MAVLPFLLNTDLKRRLAVAEMAQEAWGLECTATFRYHLAKMATSPNVVNTDLKRGLTVAQVAEKHACSVGPEDRTGGWPEPLVWSMYFPRA